MRKHLKFGPALLFSRAVIGRLITPIAVISVGLAPLTDCAAHSSRPAFQVWELEGAVAAVDASSIQVRHKSGQVVVLLTDERTTYVHNKQPASKDLIVAGTRVIVQIERRGAVDHAVRVEIFEGARRSSMRAAPAGSYESQRRAFNH